MFTNTQILLLLNASSRVSHRGARGRRRAKQSSVWWLLPQIVTTKHPEYWAATLLIWRQAINSVPAQWGKRSPQRPQFVSSASVWTHIIFIWQCLCWGSAVERVDVQALISNTCLYQLLTCPYFKLKIMSMKKEKVKMLFLPCTYEWMSFQASKRSTKV